MGLKERLQDDLKDAMRARDERRKAVIRMSLTAIGYAEVEEGGELDEPAVAAVLQKQARQRRETLEELRAAGRLEQVAKDEEELAILEAYLPKLMTREEIAEEARGVIAEVGATGMGQMGAVMREVMSRLKGRADGRIANEVVRELLSSQ
jgi:uncharacterized protein YqeY